jgi:hypothetical protein
VRSAGVQRQYAGTSVLDAWKVLGAIGTPESFNAAQIGSTPNSALFSSMLAPSVVVPGLVPASISAWFTQSRNVSE